MCTPFGGSAAVTGRADPGFDVPGLHWAGLGSTALLSKASYGGTAGRRLGCWDVVEAWEYYWKHVTLFCEMFSLFSSKIMSLQPDIMSVQKKWNNSKNIPAVDYFFIYLCFKMNKGWQS